MRAFESQLEAVVAKFQAAREEAARVTAEAEGQRVRVCLMFID